MKKKFFHLFIPFCKCVFVLSPLLFRTFFFQSCSFEQDKLIFLLAEKPLVSSLQELIFWISVVRCLKQKSFIVFRFFGCEIPFFPQKFWIFWTSQKIHHKNCFSNKKCWSRSHFQVNISCLEKYPFLQLFQIFFISCLCLSSFDKVSFDKIDLLKKKTSFISSWFCAILSQEKLFPIFQLSFKFFVFVFLCFFFSCSVFLVSFIFFEFSKQKSFSKKKTLSVNL